MKKCPFCAEEIQCEAVKCKHCGEFIKNNGDKHTKAIAPKLRDVNAIKCPCCDNIIVPKVTRGKNGMHSKICPLCGKNIDDIWDQGIGQITFKISNEKGFKILGVLVLLIIVVLIIKFCLP